MELEIAGRNKQGLGEDRIGEGEGRNTARRREVGMGINIVESW